MSQLLETALSMLLSGPLRQGTMIDDGPYPYCEITSITPIPFELQLNHVVVDCDDDGDPGRRWFACIDAVTADGDVIPLVRQEINR